MDEYWGKWLSDLEIDDCQLLTEYDMNFLEEELKGGNSVSWESHSPDPNFTTSNNKSHSSSLEENMGFDNGVSDLKQHASSEKNLFSSSMSCTLHFEDSTALTNVPNKTSQYHGEHSKVTQEETENRKSKRGISTFQSQDKVITERKRRENLTKMFIQLSALIPGLKKMDKFSIIKDAISYVKYLQNRVKDLEEESKKEIKSVAFFKNNKPNVIVDDFSWISDVLDRPMKTFHNVQTFVSAKDVLIRVICDKRKGIVTELMSNLAAHNLSIICSNVLLFGNSTLIITIITKVERESSMAMDNVVKILNEDLLRWCNKQQ